MVVDIYILLNDVRTLNFILQYYQFASNIYIVDDYTHNLEKLTEYQIIQATPVMIEARQFIQRPADWIIIINSNELLDVKNLKEKLKYCSENNYTTIKVVGFEMFANNVPTNISEFEKINQAVPSPKLTKEVIFNPRATEKRVYTNIDIKLKRYKYIDWRQLSLYELLKMIDISIDIKPIIDSYEYFRIFKYTIININNGKNLDRIQYENFEIINSANINEAIKQANGEYIVFINNGYMFTNYLQGLTNYLNVNSYDLLISKVITDKNVIPTIDYIVENEIDYLNICINKDIALQIDFSQSFYEAIKEARNLINELNGLIVYTDILAGAK